MWNATSLVGLELKANKASVAAGQLVTYQIKVRNLGPAPQPFAVTDPIPANTTFACGSNYNASTKAVEWSGTLGANQTRTITFQVKVNAHTRRWTVITNEATLSDDGSGSSASATTIVK